jgi:hypothetical protein
LRLIVDNAVIIKEDFFVISADDKRDQHFTHYVQKKVSEYLLRINYNPKVMHEFNDGCADVLATTVSELGYESVLRNFFETVHAKGAEDAAGVYIKREADLFVIRDRTSIQNGKDLFDFCNKKLQQPKSTGCKRRIFRYVESVPRNNVHNLKSIPDIRKIHCVRTTLNRSELIVSDLSCYTGDQCIASNYDSCLSFRSRPVNVIRELCTDDNSSSDDHTFQQW